MQSLNRSASLYACSVDCQPTPCSWTPHLNRLSLLLLRWVRRRYSIPGNNYLSFKVDWLTDWPTDYLRRRKAGASTIHPFNSRVSLWLWLKWVVMDLLGASECSGVWRLWEGGHSGVSHLNGGGRGTRQYSLPLDWGGRRTKALLELSIGGTTPQGNGEGRREGRNWGRKQGARKGGHGRRNGLRCSDINKEIPLRHIGYYNYYSQYWGNMLWSAKRYWQIFTDKERKNGVKNRDGQRSRSLILIFKITTGDLDLFGEKDHQWWSFQMILIFDLWSSIFRDHFSLLYPTLTCKLRVI